jgi:Ni,Fe-hydrogenase I small subunit
VSWTVSSAVVKLHVSLLGATGSLEESISQAPPASLEAKERLSHLGAVRCTSCAISVMRRSEAELPSGPNDTAWILKGLLLHVSLRR